MATFQRSRYCSTCKKQTLHQFQRLSLPIVILFTVLTAGLFAIVWVPYRYLVGWWASGMRCQTCGRGRIT